MDLFLSASQTTGVWLGLTYQLDLEIPRTDFLVQRATSIILETYGKVKFSKNILYSIMP